MITALVGAALLLGLAGGPHCAAMCGPLSTGVIRFAGATGDTGHAAWHFHAGRIVGYTLAGAAVAQAVQGLAWLAANATVLRPVGTLLHVAVLLWGMSLLVLGRQPATVGAAGRRLWNRLRPLLGRRGGMFTSGLLWTFMPCGLLYSALLAASLSGGPAAGAAAMALFATGSALSLALAPRILDRVRMQGDRLRKDAGTRAAGALIIAASTWAVWTDLAQRVAAWCGIA